MVFLESARQGGSEKTSFATYLVKKLTIFNAQKNFGAFGTTVHNNLSIVLSIEAFFPSPPPPNFGGALPTPPRPEVKTRLPMRTYAY